MTRAIMQKTVELPFQEESHLRTVSLRLRFLPLAEKNGIGTAMESSMYRFDEEKLGQLDILMTDIKIFDSELHRAYTGISNSEAFP